MIPTCQRCGEAEAETKVRETRVDTGETIWWRYLCPVCLDLEYGPWLKLMRQ